MPQEPAEEAEPAEAAAEPTKAEERYPATVANAVTFELGGAERRWVLKDATQATINRLVNPPAVVLLARADSGKESIMINLGKVDLDRAKPPHEVRGERAAGVRVVYVDPGGVKVTGGIETDSDHLVIDGWDPQSLRLQARFRVTLGDKTALGSLDITLHNPFEH